MGKIGCFGGKKTKTATKPEQGPTPSLLITKPIKPVVEPKEPIVSSRSDVSTASPGHDETHDESSNSVVASIPEPTNKAPSPSSPDRPTIRESNVPAEFSESLGPKKGELTPVQDSSPTHLPSQLNEKNLSEKGEKEGEQKDFWMEPEKKALWTQEQGAAPETEELVPATEAAKEETPKKEMKEEKAAEKKKFIIPEANDGGLDFLIGHMATPQQEPEPEKIVETAPSGPSVHDSKRSIVGGTLESLAENVAMTEPVKPQKKGVKDDPFLGRVVGLTDDNVEDFREAVTKCIKAPVGWTLGSQSDQATIYWTPMENNPTCVLMHAGLEIRGGSIEKCVASIHEVHEWKNWHPTCFDFELIGEQKALEYRGSSFNSVAMGFVKFDACFGLKRFFVDGILVESVVAIPENDPELPKMRKGYSRSDLEMYTMYVPTSNGILIHQYAKLDLSYSLPNWVLKMIMTQVAPTLIKTFEKNMVLVDDPKRSYQQRMKEDQSGIYRLMKDHMKENLGKFVLQKWNEQDTLRELFKNVVQKPIEKIKTGENTSRSRDSRLHRLSKKFSRSRSSLGRK